MSDLGPRPKTALPIAPHAAPSKAKLPLAPQARDVDRAWKPLYAVWEITLKCDLACRHCGSRAGRARPDELSTTEALELVKQMAELGVMEVTLIGGEAYLRDDWTEIARAVRSYGMSCTMTTGGKSLDATRAKAAKDAGIQSVSVSLDGNAATHDALRGVRGSYDSAINALRHLRDAGVQISTNTQICRPNLREIPDVLETVADAGIHSWQFQLTVAMGRASDEPSILLQPYQLIEVMPMIGRLAERAKERRVRIWPGNNIGYFGPYEAALRGGMPRGHMASCGAGRSTLGIEANGDIKGCPSLPTADYVGGNVREQSLKDIWERAAPLRFTRDRTVEDLWGYCRDCYYNDTCRAGCSWTTHVLFGKPGNNPYCHHRALEFLREGKREKIVRTVAAEGMPFDYGKYEIIVEDWPADERAVAEKIGETGEGWLLRSEAPGDAEGIVRPVTTDAYAAIA